MLTLGVSSPLWGQLYTGSISGQVADQSAAMIANANVTATDVDRKYTYTTQTDSTGYFVIHEVPPGQYTLTVEAKGFKKYVHEAFKVDVATAVTVHAVLPVSAGTIEVVVSDTGAPLLQTEDASVGQTIDHTFVNDLPLIGRSVTDLVYLSPGVNPAAGQAFGPPSLSGLDITQLRQTNFVSNGSRNGQSDMLVDGISATEAENNGGSTWAIFSPNVDSVQEFKVQQGNFSAEYGQTGSTIVNAVTRSGTNNYHGSVYTFARNNITDARNYFSPGPIPPVHWYDYGGTFGGPIIKNKTFLFVDYDGWRSLNLHTASAGVPDALERTGDFSELCTYRGGTGFDANGNCINADGSKNLVGQIFDPFVLTVNPDGSFTHTAPIPHNQIQNYISPGNPLSPNGTLANTPGNLLDPVSLKLVSYYPSPNMPSSFPGYDPLFNNWYGQGAAKTVLNQLDVKIDHRFNPNNQLSVRFFRGWGSNDNGAHIWNNPGDPYYAGAQVTRSIGLAINFTKTISPTMFLTVSAGDAYNHVKAQTPNVSPVTTLGMPSYITDSGDIAFPQVYVNEGSDVGVGSSAWTNYSPGAETRHLLGSVTKILGRHELKFGAELRLEYLNVTFNAAPAGIYNIDGGDTSQCGNCSLPGGNAFASFMVGENDGWGYYEMPVQPAMGAHKTAQFVQDNWKVNSNLTLNLGVRYDIEFPRTERYNRMSYFDPTQPSPITAPAGSGLQLNGAWEFTGVNGVGRSVNPTYWGEIQPRFGFAYRLGNLTSIRGGYGIYYDQSLTGLAGPGALSNQGYQQFTNNTNWVPGTIGVPNSFLRNPYPQGILQPCGKNCGPGYLLGTNGIEVPVKQWNKVPQEQTWSLGIQHQLPWNTLVEADYIGKKGTHLYFGSASALDYLPASGAQQFVANPSAATAFVPNPLAGLTGQPGTIEQWRLWAPYPQYGGGDGGFGTDLRGTANPIANSSYNSLQLKAEKRLSSGMQLLVSYVWSKSFDDSSADYNNTTFLSGGSYGTENWVQNPFNLKAERSLSWFNTPNVFQLTWVYEMPFGRGKMLGNNMNRWLDYAVGGWQFNGTYRWDNGTPLVIFLANTQPIPTYGERPNMLGKLKQASGVNINNFFACSQPDCSDVIAQPAPFTFGNETRTDSNVRGPGNNIASASLFKSFPLGFREGARAEFRLEFFNVLNHPVFGQPATTWYPGVTNFGKITSQLNQPREGQIGLKLYF
jgi:hypothetical protein